MTGRALSSPSTLLPVAKLLLGSQKDWFITLRAGLDEALGTDVFKHDLTGVHRSSGLGMQGESVEDRFKVASKEFAKEGYFIICMSGRLSDDRHQVKVKDYCQPKLSAQLSYQRLPFFLLYVFPDIEFSELNITEYMDDNVASSGSSAQPKLQICALCTTPARYKCPRCATPTCSLRCSRKHKQDARCTGERDKAQYVPMNAYDWGTMMRDYCYLEDIGRKVSGWGNEIVRGGYTTNVGASKVGSAWRPSSGRKPTTGKSKRDMLRAHLETLGIDVELLPAGMERRNLNQSTFDQK